MSEWIAVCGEEGSDPIEIETEDDGTLLLENLTANFPGTTTLKYRNPGSQAFRALKCAGGVLKPPSGGWDLVSLYVCVNPTKQQQQDSAASLPPAAAPKRKSEFDDYHPMSNEKRRPPPSTAAAPEPLDPLATTDVILLGLKPSTTEEEIRTKMEEFGPVTMIQLKKSKDANVGYAFIRFKEKDAERKALKEKHTIDGRECVMRIPDSQQGGDKSLRKVYVSYHSPTLTKADFLEHFDRFGDVVDIFMPDPWRHFVFVTFAEQRVAASLIGKEHNLKGVSLLIKSAASLKGKKDDRSDDFGGADNMGMGGGQQMGGGYGAYGVPPWGGVQQQQQQPDPRMMMMGANNTINQPWSGGGMMGPGGMGGMGDKMMMTPNMSGPPPSAPGGMAWPGASNYGYAAQGMMDRKASMPRSSRFGI